MNAHNEAWGSDFLKMTDTQGDIFAFRFRDGSITRYVFISTRITHQTAEFYPWTPIKK